jgi:hypothetical protein
MFRAICGCGNRLTKTTARGCKFGFNSILLKAAVDIAEGSMKKLLELEDKPKKVKKHEAILVLAQE